MPYRICLLLLASLACGSSDTTAVRLQVNYDDSFELTDFDVALGEESRSVVADHEIVILPPEDFTADVMDLQIVGMRGTERWVSGRVSVTLISGKTVDAEVTLARLPCGDWCTLGATECQGDSVVFCEQSDDDDCYEWSAPTACGDNEPFCSLGVCGAECIDECAEGETRCAGPGGLQICGENDSDSCFDWEAVADCNSGNTCSAGACRSECQDECTDGEVSCSGTGTTICSDLNFDGCTETGPVVPCAGAELCNAGVCSTDACTDECTDSECSGINFRQCGNFDLDTCLDLSPGESCVPDDDCEEGMCTTAGCDVAALVCEDPPDDVCLDANTLRSFELAGTCTTGDCDYPSTDTACVDGCSAGACQLVCDTTICADEVVENQGGASAISIGTTHAYWTNGTDETVMRWTIPAGPLEVIAIAQSGASDVAQDSTHIYWTTFFDGTVMRLAKSGGSEEIFASGQEGATGLALDATHVYWANSASDTIMRRPKSGGAVEMIASGQGDAEDVELDATHIYWTTFSGDTVMRRSKSGGALETIASGQDGARRVAVDESHVYWTSGLNDQVIRRLKSGGPLETIASGQDGAMGIALDATHLYWTNVNDGTIMRWAKSGGPSEAVAAFQDGPVAIALDDTHIYWANFNGGEVTRNSRCACDL